MSERQFTLEEVKEALQRAKYYILEKDEMNQFAALYEAAYRDLTNITLSILQYPELLQIPLESLPLLERRAKGK